MLGKFFTKTLSKPFYQFARNSPLHCYSSLECTSTFFGKNIHILSKKYIYSSKMYLLIEEMRVKMKVYYSPNSSKLLIIPHTTTLKDLEEILKKDDKDIHSIRFQQ